jgi:hypothetical protein
VYIKENTPLTPKGEKIKPKGMPDKYIYCRCIAGGEKKESSEEG